jgi:fumarate hydratase class I
LSSIPAWLENVSIGIWAVFNAISIVGRAREVAFEDLGMEAIYEFTVQDMPVTVAVDSTGESVHKTGPQAWRQKIAGSLRGIPINVEA